MGRETGIKWTDSRPKAFAALPFASVSDAVMLKMLEHVARRAKSNPIVDYETELWMRGKSFHMMSLKISAAIIAAFSAGKIVPCENSEAPLTIFWRAPGILAAHRGAVLPCVVIFASFDIRARAKRHADLATELWRSFLAFHRSFPPFSRMGHFGARFRGVRSAFENANATLRRLFYGDSVALEALRFASVGSGSIIRIFGAWLPCFANPAPLHTTRSKSYEFFNRYPSHFRRSFDSAFRSLSHG